MSCLIDFWQIQKHTELYLWFDVGKSHSITLFGCRALVFKEYLQHHGHKGGLIVTPKTCGFIGEETQVSLAWMRAPGH